MARKKKPESEPFRNPRGMKCSICGGIRRAIYPSGQPSSSDTYLWCSVCDGSTIDLPADFLDKKGGS